VTNLEESQAFPIRRGGGRQGQDISIGPDATLRVEFPPKNQSTLTEGTRAVLRYTPVRDRTWRSKKGPGLILLVPVKRSRCPRTTLAGSDALIGRLPPTVLSAEP